jgi:phosphoglycolate phosphatase
MICAVIFDFDGTLIDSYAAIAASVNHVRAAHGLPPLPEAEVRRFVGRGAAFLLRNTVPNGDVDADIALYKAHHPSVLCAETRLLPGVAETLRQLKAAGLRLAVCSNKPVAFTKELLLYFNLAPLFDAAVGPEDAPHPKPAPDMLFEALRRLHVPAAESLYVGDMVVDIETARAAGVTVWVVPTGSQESADLSAARPDRLLTTISDLLPAIPNLPSVSGR